MQVILGPHITRIFFEKLDGPLSFSKEMKNSCEGVCTGIFLMTLILFSQKIKGGHHAHTPLRNLLF